MKRWRDLWVRFSGGAGSAVFKGMATLAIGSGLARMIGVASIPVLTGIYSPEDYGFLSVFTSLVLMLVPIVTLPYTTADAPSLEKRMWFRPATGAEVWVQQFADSYRQCYRFGLWAGAKMAINRCQLCRCLLCDA